MKSKKKKQPKKYVLTFLKKGEKRTLKLYRVVWTDHAISGQDKTWKSLEDVKAKTVEAITVGFLIDENDKNIALAQTVSDHGMVSEIMTIIKSCIVSKTQL